MSDKLNGICVNILSITDEEIKEMKKVIDDQKNYSHPLKMATQQKQHALGIHNEIILNQLIETKRLLEAGAPENL